MKDAIVLYPFLGRGHLVSMVELGKLFLAHKPSFSITILLLNPPTSAESIVPYISSDTTSRYIAAVSTAIPSITFHRLPAISISPNLPPHELCFELSRLSNPNIRHVLHSISQTSKLKAFIMDFVSYAAAEVAASLNIPTYYYFPAGATTLASVLYLPTIHQTTTKSLKDLGALHIPGLPQISEADIPDSMKDRGSKRYENFLNISLNMRKGDGIIVNTFEAIERKAIRALTGGLCVPESPTPPVFCIGPLISIQEGEGDDNGCFSWLNWQPCQSVVFLCFGSLGRFSAAQIKEMAVGLERSQQRFLWVVRNPPLTSSDGKNDDSGSVNREPCLEELLPEGFLERTKERGLVVKNWAPQAGILSHDSVGGFVTHCGWNSVLEAVRGGVPMVTWPLYAEQKLNRVILVEEIKVALALNESEDGFVSAEELEKRVRELMETERGKEARKEIIRLRDSGLGALEEGGSSYVALRMLLDSWN